MNIDLVYQCKICQEWYWFHLDDDDPFGDYSAHDCPLSREGAVAHRLHFPCINGKAHCPLCLGPRGVPIMRFKSQDGEFSLSSVVPPEKGKTTFYSVWRRGK